MRNTFLNSLMMKGYCQFAASENCNPGWTAEPLKSHRFVLLPPEKGANALMDKKTQSVHD